MLAAVNRSLATILALAILALGVTPPATAQPAAPTKPKASPKWVDSVNIALAEALRTHRLMFIYFRGSSVGACTRMEQTTFAHASVLRAVRDVVMVRQDVEQSEAARQFAAARKVDVGVLPAILILQPDSSEVHRFSGRFASPQDIFNMLRAAKAWWAARRLSDKDPKNVVARKAAARWRLSLTTRDQARVPLEKILELDPSGKQVLLDQVFLWLSRIYAQKPNPSTEDIAKAIDFANKAINSNAENLGGITGACLELLGSIAQNAKKYDEAAGHFRKMLETDPYDRWGQGSIGMYRLAMLASAQKKKAEAIRLLDQLVADYPFGRFAFQAVATKARMFLAKDDFGNAIKTLQLALELWPNSPAAKQAQRDINTLKQQAATRAAAGTGTTP